MEKLVVVINGKGGVGKDALCDALANAYAVTNISAITPIKEIAMAHGWRGEKDERSRRFLAELKRVFAEYNDLPNQYLLREYEKFLTDDAQVLFVHIRESDQIARFVAGVHSPCVTLLIRRRAVDELEQYGNAADDNVADYPYDLTYDNDLPLAESSVRFVAFFNDVWKQIFGA